jgi:hypothetical protein
MIGLINGLQKIEILNDSLCVKIQNLIINELDNNNQRFKKDPMRHVNIL